jgi:hypothetical protein
MKRGFRWKRALIVLIPLATIGGFLGSVISWVYGGGYAALIGFTIGIPVGVLTQNWVCPVEED